MTPFATWVVALRIAVCATITCLALASRNAFAADDYFQPPETKGGWRTLLELNAKSTAEQKAAIRERAGHRGAWERKGVQVISTERSRSTSAPQSLTLLNADEVMAASQATPRS